MFEQDFAAIKISMNLIDLIDIAQQLEKVILPFQAGHLVEDVIEYWVKHLEPIDLLLPEADQSFGQEVTACRLVLELLSIIFDYLFDEFQLFLKLLDKYFEGRLQLLLFQKDGS
jgi:hypothetical protein